MNRQFPHLRKPITLGRVTFNKIVISGDALIYAIGQRALSKEAEGLLDSAPWVRRIGDCVRPANITSAIYEAFHAALDI